MVPKWLQDGAKGPQLEPQRLPKVSPTAHEGVETSELYVPYVAKLLSEAYLI